MGDAKREIDSCKNLNDLSIKFYTPAEKHYEGIQSILESPALKPMEHFTFRASSLGENEQTPKNKPYRKVLKSLANCIQMTSCLFSLELNFGKYWLLPSFLLTRVF